MVRITLALSFATSALALVPVPRQALDPNAVGGMTIGEAGRVCGSNLELKCCNQEESSSGVQVPEDRGLLGNLLNGILGEDGLGIFDQCSPLSVTGLIGGTDIVNNHCRQKVACCDSNPVVSGGLINLGLPCIAIGGII
ncbi:fungal hydrophobin-domain-containing protein [Emericellopsis atlantica]|uniref:Hydrophobin n=1 Tax=Emericellopsis atlantica TaxID=2614577 RepID=A0A9P7ZGR7_9HYPO|nr:fungal hydrophobin-domain-containing protein [Emericellopsis atlantica]KAG9251799.1 fungal hydrophobin-domain-containing protein [Emericellopsis atlantica]